MYNEFTGIAFRFFIPEFNGQHFITVSGYLFIVGLVFQRINGYREIIFHSYRNNFIKCSYGMPATQFTCIFQVIIKIFCGQHPVFISDQPVSLDFSGIKLDLYFDIFGNGKEGTAKFIHQYFTGFLDIINIGVIAISFISQLLHFTVLIISHPITQYG